jgi:hypothetical protein
MAEGGFRGQLFMECFNPKKLPNPQVIKEQHLCQYQNPIIGGRSESDKDRMISGPFKMNPNKELLVPIDRKKSELLYQNFEISIHWYSFTSGENF